MSPKDQFIAAVRAADITNEDWLEDCLPIIKDLPFARSYIACLQNELGESLDTRSEDYREEILELEEADIWE